MYMCIVVYLLRLHCIIADTDSDISHQYTVSVRNNYDFYQKTSERHTPNDEYENFFTAYIESAAQCIPNKSRAHCNVP